MLQLMYTYYTLRAMRVRVPRQFAMIVTCLQISQMIFGVFINLYTVWVKRKMGISQVHFHALRGWVDEIENYANYLFRKRA